MITPYWRKPLYSILMPVPYEHLVSAHKMPVVAFGSSANMLKPDNHELVGLDVYLMATLMPPEVAAVFPKPVISMRGLIQAVVGSVNGAAPNPSIRPKSTLSDGAWRVFIEISDLKVLDKPHRLTDFRSFTGGKPLSWRSTTTPTKVSLIG
jgi:hypothetical protein